MAHAAAHQVFLPKSGLAVLISTLRTQGYTVLAPSLHDGVVSLAPVNSIDELARGLRDEQSPGGYRLSDADPDLFFQYTVGPDSPKRYLFPPVHRLFKMHLQADQFVLDAGPPQPPKLAFLAIRPCELAAIQIHDRVFGAAPSPSPNTQVDHYYRDARAQALLIVVNCTRAGGTCFCESMGTGPQATSGFDLALTELRAGFVVQAGSQRGSDLLALLPVREVSSTELELAEVRIHQAKHHMGRSLNIDNLPKILARNIEHPYWDEIAKRCLGCTNCTQVCPTCFCHSIEDDNELAGPAVSRTRKWDSCYTHQFSYTTAGPGRASIRARHRHWVLHKLSTWHDQFGTSGCVGCGRCITWCPVGIDITQDAAAIRNNQAPNHVPDPKNQLEIL